MENVALLGNEAARKSQCLSFIKFVANASAHATEYVMH